ncbi:MAG: hypothetical protein MI867_30545, partial [Pseudomonadales bacterium]|nr:hypothetical protein [Pseudomonadales bacterium]
MALDQRQVLLKRAHDADAEEAQIPEKDPHDLAEELEAYRLQGAEYTYYAEEVRRKTAQKNQAWEQRAQENRPSADEIDQVYSQRAAETAARVPSEKDLTKAQNQDKRTEIEIAQYLNRNGTGEVEDPKQPRQFPPEWYSLPGKTRPERKEQGIKPGLYSLGEARGSENLILFADEAKTDPKELYLPKNRGEEFYDAVGTLQDQLNTDQLETEIAVGAMVQGLYRPEAEIVLNFVAEGQAPKAVLYRH